MYSSVNCLNSRRLNMLRGFENIVSRMVFHSRLSLGRLNSERGLGIRRMCMTKKEIAQLHSGMALRS